MKRHTTTLATRLLPAMICASPLIAGAGQGDAEPIVTAPPASPWEFRITPYGWLTAIDGSTGVNGYVSDVDASFSDIFDVLDMAAALQFEARNGRWGIIADLFYAELSEDATLPGPLATQLDIDFTQFLAEVDLYYRLAEQPEGFLDLYAGFRYNNLDLNFDAVASTRREEIRRNGSADKSWADPIIGLRGQWDINEKWYLSGKGDIGGFGVNSDFTWNLQATVGYNFTPCVSAEVGYRYFDTDYDDDGFTYDVAHAGLLLGVNIKF